MKIKGKTDIHELFTSPPACHEPPQISQVSHVSPLLFVFLIFIPSSSCDCIDRDPTLALSRTISLRMES